MATRPNRKNQRDTSEVSVPLPRCHASLQRTCRSNLTRHGDVYIVCSYHPLQPSTQEPRARQRDTKRRAAPLLLALKSSDICKCSPYNQLLLSLSPSVLPLSPPSLAAVPYPCWSWKHRVHTAPSSRLLCFFFLVGDKENKQRFWCFDSNGWESRSSGDIYSSVLHVALQLTLGWIIFVHVPSSNWCLAWVFSELSLESCTCALPLQHLDSCLQPYHFPPSLKQIIAPLLKTVKSALITFFSFSRSPFRCDSRKGVYRLGQAVVAVGDSDVLEESEELTGLSWQASGRLKPCGRGSFRAFKS